MASLETSSDTPPPNNRTGGSGSWCWAAMAAPLCQTTRAGNQTVSQLGFADATSCQFVLGSPAPEMLLAFLGGLKQALKDSGSQPMVSIS